VKARNNFLAQLLLHV